MNKSYTVVWNESKGCWSVAGESAKQRGKSSCSGVRAGAMAAVVLGLAPLMPAAHALPTGGVVTHGTANIQTIGQDMVVGQTTPKAVIKWDSFGVGHGERLTFSQRASDMALNYVSGSNRSIINGSINAGGKVFIVNPQGIVFNGGAQVNVGGLVASTRPLDPDLFYNNTNGEFIFEGGGTNFVENNGARITAQGGDVVFLGARAINNGMIRANGGTVALGAGDRFTVSMGSGLLKLEVNAGSTQALAQNAGMIQASDGQVLLKAVHTNASPLTTVVNNSGIIEANMLNNASGKIVLDGGSRGVVDVAGRLTANAFTGPGDGGAIEAAGQRVRVRLGTTFDTRAINGYTGNVKIAASEVKVEKDTPAIVDATIHANTLNRNLADTNIELASTAGDVVVNAPVDWSSGNSLTLNAQHGASGKTVLNSTLATNGTGSALHLKADDRIQINGQIQLSGTGNRLALNTTTPANGTGPSAANPASANYFLGGSQANITLNGDGTAFLSNDIPHNIIQNQQDLQAVNRNLNGRYVLGVDLHGTEIFQSIGGAYATFNGSFDGLGHTLTGFNVVNGGGNVGLFSSSAGIIRNLTLTSMAVSSSNAGAMPLSVGTLAGRNAGLIDNVRVSATTVYGDNYRFNVTGGLVGTNDGGTISHSTFAGDVYSGSATHTLGGLVGINQASLSSLATILDSHTSGTVSGNLLTNDRGGMGGLVGVNNGGVIRNSGSTSLVASYSAKRNIGGLVGLNHNSGLLDNVSSSGMVSASHANNAGGLVGINSGVITQSHSSGQVAGTTDSTIGGLIGLNTGGTVSDSTASGKVDNYEGANTGGLVGANHNGTLRNVQASGDGVEDNRNAGNIGGLVGYNGEGGLIQNGVASSATVNAYYPNSGTRIGGLVGANAGTIEYGMSSIADVRAGEYATIGGLVGENRGRISDSSSASAVQAGSYSVAGGLAGQNSGTITAGYASGIVAGDYYATVGGLVGHNLLQGTIDYSSATGRVTGVQSGWSSYWGYGMTLGGLVGLNEGKVTYSQTSTQVDFAPGQSQTFGALVGVNAGAMLGNTVSASAGQVPLAGANYGVIDMSW